MKYAKLYYFVLRKTLWEWNSSAETCRSLILGVNYILLNAFLADMLTGTWSVLQYFLRNQIIGYADVCKPLI